jgi:hypothetical protein
MNLSKNWASFVSLDPLPGSALGPFARKVEQLGYSSLWFAEGVGRESFALAMREYLQRMKAAPYMAPAPPEDPPIVPDRCCLG